MKPSHLTTPRTLAECQFTTGYQTCHFSDQPTFTEFLVSGIIGLGMIGVVLAFAFGYWG